MTDQQGDPEVEELPASDEEPGTSMHDYLKFRKIARTRFTKLQPVIKKQVDKKGKTEVLQGHRENLLEYYNECLSHHTNYVNKLKPTGEEQTKMEKWATELDATYRKWTEFIDRYIREAVDSDPDDESLEDPGSSKSYTDVSNHGAAVTDKSVDGWIYQPFEETPTRKRRTNGVTMAMLPNLKQFAGDPRDWPVFKQTFKSMVHDMFASDAHRCFLATYVLV